MLIYLYTVHFSEENILKSKRNSMGRFKMFPRNILMITASRNATSPPQHYRQIFPFYAP